MRVWPLATLLNVTITLPRVLGRASKHLWEPKEKGLLGPHTLVPEQPFLVQGAPS